MTEDQKIDRTRKVSKLVWISESVLCAWGRGERKSWKMNWGCVKMTAAPPLSSVAHCHVEGEPSTQRGADVGQLSLMRQSSKWKSEKRLRICQLERLGRRAAVRTGEEAESNMESRIWEKTNDQRGVRYVWWPTMVQLWGLLRPSEVRVPNRTLMSSSGLVTVGWLHGAW